MSLLHKPSQVIAASFISLGLATPPAANGAWPVFNDHHAPSPEELICVYDTTGVIQSQSQIGGKVCEHYGIQIKSRAKHIKTSFLKLQSIVTAFDAFERTAVEIESTNYTIIGASRKSSILSLGPESTDYVLWIHTVNYTVSLILN